MGRLGMRHRRTFVLGADAAMERIAKNATQLLNERAALTAATGNGNADAKADEASEIPWPPLQREREGEGGATNTSQQSGMRLRRTRGSMSLA